MRIHISSQREIEKEHGRRRAVYKKVEDTVLDTKEGCGLADILRMEGGNIGDREKRMEGWFGRCNAKL